ncbi:MAG TPA: hypothetical protein VGR74_18480 [Actinomycetota bacterium]|jgi:hypothetical protein|nr:hypothetical protein [Actinomycetota bacterium]
MAQRAKSWPGWIMFAAVMLTMIGAFNVLQGLAALLQRQVSYLDTGRLIVVNLTTWGLLALVSGALLVAVGLGLLSHNGLARAVAVALVALHALVQLTALAAFPIWSLLMIALDVVVLFALTVHWPGWTPGWTAGWPPGRTAGTGVVERETGPDHQPRGDRTAAASPAPTATGTPASAPASTPRPAH